LIEQGEQSLQDLRRRRGTAGNVKIDGNHLRDPSNDRVATSEAATIPSTIPDCDDPFWIRDGMIGTLQRFAHILGHWPGHHQHIGMARRGNEPEAKAFDIVVGVVKRVDLKFASITGSSIDFAYGKATSEAPPCGAADGYCKFGHGGIV
jgi:hypothetical protein